MQIATVIEVENAFVLTHQSIMNAVMLPRVFNQQNIKQ
jgi:hypothetical protein